MAEYSRIFGSNFPNSVMELHNFEDVTSTTYPKVKQYMDYCIKANLESAALMLTKNPELKKCLMNADAFNLIDEEIHNTQIYALKAGQVVSIEEDVPVSPSANLVWIGGT